MPPASPVGRATLPRRPVRADRSCAVARRALGSCCVTFFRSRVGSSLTGARWARWYELQLPCFPDRRSANVMLTSSLASGAVFGERGRQRARPPPSEAAPQRWTAVCASDFVSFPAKHSPRLEGWRSLRQTCVSEPSRATRSFCSCHSPAASEEQCRCRVRLERRMFEPISSCLASPPFCPECGGA